MVGADGLGGFGFRFPVCLRLRAFSLQGLGRWPRHVFRALRG